MWPINFPRRAYGLHNCFLLGQRKAPVAQSGERCFDEPGFQFNASGGPIAVELHSHAQRQHGTVWIPRRDGHKHYCVNCSSVSTWSNPDRIIKGGESGARCRLISFETAFGQMQQKDFGSRNFALDPLLANYDFLAKHRLISLRPAFRIAASSYQELARARGLP